MLLVENTVGAGAQLGSRFRRTARDSRIRCEDDRSADRVLSRYMSSAGFGYDVSTAEGLKQTVAEAERVLGLENVRVIHANDSKGALGSHIDRHANIGEGYIGLDGFRRILAHPRLRNKAFILETPVEQAGRRPKESRHPQKPMPEIAVRPQPNRAEMGRALEGRPELYRADPDSHRAEILRGRDASLSERPPAHGPRAQLRDRRRAGALHVDARLQRAASDGLGCVRLARGKRGHQAAARIRASGRISEDRRNEAADASHGVQLRLEPAKSPPASPNIIAGTSGSF